MKRVLFYCLILIAFTSCEKDELEIFPIEKSFENPEEQLARYSTQLASGTNGWKATIAPTEGGLLGGYIKFESNGEAKLVMDYSGAAASSASTNKYTLNVTQLNPTLSIDKTSPFGIHANTANLDTDFTFNSISGDTIKLIGNTKGNVLKLIKASAQESTDYLAGKIIQSATSVNALISFPLYFKRLAIGSKNYDLIISPNYGAVTINHNNGGTFKRFHTFYAHTASGIIFKTTFFDGDITIAELSNLVVNNTSKTATLKVGANNATITNVATPLAVDLQAAQNFYTSPTNGTYWETYDGFTVEGVSDAFNIGSIPGLQVLIYWPKYNVDATNKPYDLFGFVINNAINYGPAAFPTLTTDGRIIYTYFGLLGNPGPNLARVTATRQRWADTQGFYAIQTSAGTYDLVSARDGKAWISFE